MSGSSSAGPLALPGPWDLVADGYQEITRPFVEQFSRSGLAKLRYDAETRAIDVACGPGTTALMLAPAVEYVTCVDFSPAMLEQLRRNASATGVANLDAVEADGQALPFADGSFNLGISMFGLMFFPDRRKGFAELHRVLAHGGQALVSSWASADRSSYTQAIIAALEPDDAEPQPPRPLSGLEDPAVFEAEMRGAGFVEVAAEAVEHGIEVADVERLWDDCVRATAPLTLMKHHSEAAEWAETERAALERLRRRFGGRLPTTLTATAWIATGRKP